MEPCQPVLLYSLFRTLTSSIALSLIWSQKSLYHLFSLIWSPMNHFYCFPYIWSPRYTLLFSSSLEWEDNRFISLYCERLYIFFYRFISFMRSPKKIFCSTSFSEALRILIVLLLSKNIYFFYPLIWSPKNHYILRLLLRALRTFLVYYLLSGAQITSFVLAHI